jgi:hypothetical protein
MKIEHTLRNAGSVTFTREDIKAECQAILDAVVLDWRVVKKLKKFLGKTGLDFFSECWERYKSVTPVICTGGIPHPVHFREGMQIRNFLRIIPECRYWSHENFENEYPAYIEAAIGVRT